MLLDRLYKLLETVRVLHWESDGNLKSVIRYFVVRKGVRGSQVKRKRHKNVQLVPHGTVDEVTRLILVAKSLQDGAISVYPQISIGNVPRTSVDQDGYFEVCITESRLAPSVNLSRHPLNEDARGCSTTVLYSAWDGVLDDRRGKKPKSFNVRSSAIQIPPIRIYSSVGNLDLVERINSKTFEGIDFGEIIKLRRHAEDIADDNLGDNLLSEVEEGLSIEDEEPLIRRAIHEMVDCSEASEEMRTSLRNLCLRYWDIFSMDHTQTKISDLTPMPVYPLEVFDFLYLRVRPM
eukprot:snap_masked-scaffold_68-processed-gene-0.59-mRNA-1 protein AED:1.00 eAED:1.00 QI:0/0/0/0/1/1/2/0/290